MSGLDIVICFRVYIFIEKGLNQHKPFCIYLINFSFFQKFFFILKHLKKKTTWKETRAGKIKRALFGTGFRIDLLTIIMLSEIIVKADFDCTLQIKCYTTTQK